MPLAFESLSHKTVAFGFFHIETDMLLLEDHFFFADVFCNAVSGLAEHPGNPVFEATWPGYRFTDLANMGDLMGAIHGVRLSGFIGRLYRIRPFPDRPGDFRQKSVGGFSREWVTAEIRRWAVPCRIPFRARFPAGDASIGQFRFSNRVFHELIDYVRRGGYPRWAAGQRPGYVFAMVDALEKGGFINDHRRD